MHPNLIGMPMKATTLVARRDKGELVSRFKAEVFPEFEGGVVAWVGVFHFEYAAFWLFFSMCQMM